MGRPEILLPLAYVPLPSLNYTGVEDERGFAIKLFSHLLTCFVMERTSFDDYKACQQLDPN
jgi:hypothetical protein